MIDLHVHSTASDGSFSPTELVDYAIEKGLQAFALTDHDSVAGVDEAISYAAALRKTREDVPEVIPGIEFSTEYEGKDVHIVGLYIDYHSEVFQKHLEDFVHSRDVRNEKMCDLLRQGTGMDISYAKLQNSFPDSVITRAHYAKYMLEHKYVKSMNEAFERYIGDHCPYFLPREKVTPADAIHLILSAGGIPVLAHPLLYGMGLERLEHLVSELKATGLIALEAIYSSYTSSDEREMRTLAAKYELAVSGGSDFHGTNKPGLDLGTGYGHLYIPSEVLIHLKNLKKWTVH
ncbi:MAG: PHP domain-containing protein [Lachnospiraceae bacterium]|nr:PHP domain-containing protein [Lachnospiraceae bacterium]